MAILEGEFAKRLNKDVTFLTQEYQRSLDRFSRLDAEEYCRIDEKIQNVMGDLKLTLTDFFISLQSKAKFNVFDKKKAKVYLALESRPLDHSMIVKLQNLLDSHYEELDEWASVNHALR